jgi:Ran GTPase-activating protein (RanGAP) involved in mRNA processing and transport
MENKKHYIIYIMKAKKGGSFITIKDKSDMEYFLKNSSTNNAVSLEIEGFLDKVYIQDFKLKLMQMNVLEKLYISGVKIGALTLAEGLVNNKTLKTLQLSYTNIGNEGIIALSKIKGLFSRLNVLSLLGNKIGYTGIRAFTKALIRDKFVKSIDDNERVVSNIVQVFEDKGVTSKIRKKHISEIAEGIADRMGFCISLKELDLSDNVIDEKSAMLIANAFVLMSPLTKLSLMMNPIEDNGLISIANTLHNLPNLEDLNLTDIHVGNKGVMELADIIPKHEKIKKLNLSENDATKEGLLYLIKKIPKNIEIVDISDNDINSSDTKELKKLAKYFRLIL